MDPLVKEIRYFIDEKIRLGQGGNEIANHDSLLERGIIDSTRMLELVSFLEEKYPIRIADEERTPNNLDSINGLVTFLEKKLSEVRDEA